MIKNFETYINEKFDYTKQGQRKEYKSIYDVDSGDEIYFCFDDNSDIETKIVKHKDSANIDGKYYVVLVVKDKANTTGMIRFGYDKSYSASPIEVADVGMNTELGYVSTNKSLLIDWFEYHKKHPLRHLGVFLTSKNVKIIR